MSNTANLFRNWDFLPPPPEASPARLDPEKWLMAGVLVQAWKDLTSSDPIIFLDAFAWLVLTDPDVLPIIARGGIFEKRSATNV